MFLDLFYGLREEGVPVAIQEWQAFLTALEQGLHGSSLLRFYHLGRACLVKSETYFDAYDRVFARVMQGVEGEFGDEVTNELLEWLRDPKNLPELTPEQLAELERLSNDELMRKFLETLAEQTERHDGGDRWIGTGGRSPYGHGGTHPTGIRVGGPGKSRSAMKVAEERRFRDYRTDVVLDHRQLRVALRRLRQLTRRGAQTELDLDETIDETCRNAGEIELMFRAPRRNDVRLLLRMDVGGTMDPYYEPVSQLLTALHEERGLRDFQAYYFHNTIYDHLYTRARMLRGDEFPTADVLRRLDERWKVAIVGDAAMHPAELVEPNGNIDPRRISHTPSIAWLHRIAAHFDRSVWINPETPGEWDYIQTTRVIRRLFPMFHLSTDAPAASAQPRSAAISRRQPATNGSASTSPPSSRTARLRNASSCCAFTRAAERPRSSRSMRRVRKRPSRWMAAYSSGVTAAPTSVASSCVITRRSCRPLRHSTTSMMTRKGRKTMRFWMLVCTQASPNEIGGGGPGSGSGSPAARVSTVIRSPRLLFSVWARMASPRPVSGRRICSQRRRVWRAPPRKAPKVPVNMACPASPNSA
jgi:uncharacterized protein with von Willebrand factor type A (vWA) domain